MNIQKYNPLSGHFDYVSDFGFIVASKGVLVGGQYTYNNPAITISTVAVVGMSKTGVYTSVPIRYTLSAGTIVFDTEQLTDSFEISFALFNEVSGVGTPTPDIFVELAGDTMLPDAVFIYPTTTNNTTTINGSSVSVSNSVTGYITTLLAGKIEGIVTALIVNPTDAVNKEYVDDLFASLIATNGLYATSGVIKLGGALIEDTTITGNFDLILGDKYDLFKSLLSYTSNETSFNSNDGITQSELHLSPLDFALTANDGVADSGFVFQTSSPTGIIVKDNISNIGLRGNVVFTPTSDKDYIQKFYVDAVVTGALIPKGNWDSLTNTPTLTSSTNPGGNYLYIVSVASTGVTTLDGETTFNVGDLVWFSVDIGIWYRVASSFVAQNLQTTTDLGNITTRPIISSNGFITATHSNGQFTVISGGNTGYFNNNTFSISNGTNEIVGTPSYVSIKEYGVNKVTSTTTNVTYEDSVTTLSGSINAAAWTDNRTITFPDEDGILLLSVNGVKADSSGNVQQPILLEEEFYKITGVAPNHIGAIAYATEGTIINIPSVLNHPGIKQLQTASTLLNSRGIFTVGSATNIGSICYGNIGEVNFIISLPAITNAFYAVGASTNLLLAPANTIYFRKITTDANWICVAVQGGVTTTVDSGIIAAPNTWYNFNIVFSDINIDFFIDGVLVGTIAKTILDSVTLSPFFYILNLLAGTVRTMDMDYLKVSTRNLIR